jgi:exonuclease VII small subunit
MTTKKTDISIEATGEVIPYPESDALKREVEKLRTELSMLVLERDELRYVECKNIEMAYMLNFGGLEYHAYEHQCEYLRLKRKTDLIQAVLNRQEEINLPGIERQLDQEFSDYKEKLDEKIREVNDALERSRIEVLSKDESREIKKLYRQIVKALHPDLNTDLSRVHIDLFTNAVEAYEKGDLQALRLIAELVGDRELTESKEDSLIVLVREKERFEKMLKSMKDSITKIKSSYPYTMKDLVTDEAKIEKRRAELENIISQYEEGIKLYSERIKEMLR